MDYLVASTSNLTINVVEGQETHEIDSDHADLVLKTNDGTLKVHKSVVRCCPYFAAMTDGNWLESQSSIISLDGYSYKAVRFILEHLYKPKESIPNNQNLGELLALVDMLGVQSLLELVCSTMVMKVCHNFHKPCKDCIEGVMNCFQLAATYYLVEIHTKCLEWLTKYFYKTWNSKSFANLPEQLQQSCLESIKNSMSVDNIIMLSLNCQQLQEMLPTVKWVDPVNSQVKLLSASCVMFIQEHFNEILQSAKFKSLSQEDTWNLSRVETVILEAAPNLPVEQACLSYLALENLIHGLVKFDEDQLPDATYMDFVKKLHKAVENRLIQRVGMATKCSAWNALPPTKQKSIMQMGFFDPIDSKTNVKNSCCKPHVPNLRRNLSLNTSLPNGDSNTRAIRAPLRTEHFRQTNVVDRSSLRSTGPRVRTSIHSQFAGTSGTVSRVQPLNHSAPVITRSQSARIVASGTSRASRSNQIGYSNQPGPSNVD